MTTASHDPVVARRLPRRATTGCFVLLMVPAALLAYFWYEVWHTGHLNTQRKHAAVASVLANARDASYTTARALNSSHATAPDAVTEVIWRHTHAPVIAYDPTHGSYTATTSWSTTYNEKGIVLGGGPIKLEHCFTLTSTHTASADPWKTKMTEGRDDICTANRALTRQVAFVQNHLRNMSAKEVSRAEVTRLLNPTRQQSAYDVKQVTLQGNVAVAVVRLRSDGGKAPLQQCYSFTRQFGANTDTRAVDAVPLATC